MWIPSLSQHLLITTLIKDQPLDLVVRRDLGRRAASASARCSVGSPSGSIGAKQFSVNGSAASYVNAALALLRERSRPSAACDAASCRPFAICLEIDRPMSETPIAGSAHPPSYDALTLTLTRPAFLKELAEQAQLAQRSGNAFCLLLLDVDHLQNINDCHGVAAGDDVLSRAGRPLPPRDRRARLASVGIHLRPFRRRRADRPRAAVRLEPGRDARRGAALRGRRKAHRRPHQRHRLDRRRAVSHRRVRRRAAGAYRARAARREAVRPRPRRGREHAAESRRTRQGRRPLRLAGPARAGRALTSLRSAASACTARVPSTKFAYLSLRRRENGAFPRRIRRAAWLRTCRFRKRNKNEVRESGGSCSFSGSRCAGGEWCRLDEVEPADVDGFGVFVVWRAGDVGRASVVLYVGRGALRQAIADCRRDPDHERQQRGRAARHMGKGGSSRRRRRRRLPISATPSPLGRGSALGGGYTRPVNLPLTG